VRGRALGGDEPDDHRDSEDGGVTAAEPRHGWLRFVKGLAWCVID
jgi:hypothetical protein